jgi:flagellar protein FlgJ
MNISVNNIGGNNVALLQAAQIQREHSQVEDFEAVLGRAMAGGSSELKEAAIEMESFFINMMFQAMRRTIPEPQGMFERSQAEKLFQEMLDQEMAINMARAGGIGIAQTLYAQLQDR